MPQGVIHTSIGGDDTKPKVPDYDPMEFGSSQVPDYDPNEFGAQQTAAQPTYQPGPGFSPDELEAPPEEPSLLDRFENQWYNRPILSAENTGGYFDPSAIPKYIDDPSLNPQDQWRIPELDIPGFDLPDWAQGLNPSGGSLRSLGAGMLEGAANMGAGFSTPLNIATMGTAGLYGKTLQTAPKVAQAARLATKALSAPVTAAGAGHVVRGAQHGDPSEMFTGAVTAAGGGLGMMTPPVPRQAAAPIEPAMPVRPTGGMAAPIEQIFDPRQQPVEPGIMAGGPEDVTGGMPVREPQAPPTTFTRDVQRDRMMDLTSTGEPKTAAGVAESIARERRVNKGVSPTGVERRELTFVDPNTGEMKPASAAVPGDIPYIEGDALPPGNQSAEPSMPVRPAGRERMLAPNIEPTEVVPPAPLTPAKGASFSDWVNNLIKSESGEFDIDPLAKLKKSVDDYLSKKPADEVNESIRRVNEARARLGLPPIKTPKSALGTGEIVGEQGPQPLPGEEYVGPETDPFRLDTARMKREYENAPLNQERIDQTKEWNRSQKVSAIYEGRNINDIHTPLDWRQRLARAATDKAQEFSSEHARWFSEQEELLPEDQFFQEPPESKAAFDTEYARLQDERNKLVERLYAKELKELAPPKKDIEVPFKEKVKGFLKSESGEADYEAPIARLRELFGKKQAGTITPEELNEAKTLAQENKEVINTPSTRFSSLSSFAQKAVIDMVDQGTNLVDALDAAEGRTPPTPPKQPKGVLPQLGPTRRPVQGPMMPGAPERFSSGVLQGAPPLVGGTNPVVQGANPRILGPTRRPRLGPRRPPRGSPQGPKPALVTKAQLDPNVPVEARKAEVAKPSRYGLAGEIWNAPRSLQSVDLPGITSAAFRQSRPLAFTAEWFKAWVSAAKAFRGDEYLAQSKAKIQNSKYGQSQYQPVLDNYGRIAKYKEMPSVEERLGLATTDMKTHREDVILSSLAEKIPLYGRYVKASNRAYTAFLNELRNTYFERLADGAEASGRSVLTDEVLGKKLADFINNGTGRGTLKFLGGRLNAEGLAEELGMALYSPRALAGRLAFMNPHSYVQADPMVRLEYWKGMGRTMASWTAFSAVASLLPKAHVSLDPNNSDFGKVRIGNTRIDPGAGWQQLMVLMSREASGGTVASTGPAGVPGKFKKLGSTPMSPTMASLAGKYAANQMNPTASLVLDMLNATQKEPVDMTDRGLQLVLPMMAADIAEAAKHDKYVAAAFAPILSSMGFSNQTYEKGDFGQPKITPFIKQVTGAKLPTYKFEGR